MTEAESRLDIVRDGFEAAARGDLDAIAGLLDENVYWGAEGGGGCENRAQTLRWMREGMARGIRVELLNASELPDGRVLVVLQRAVGEDEGDPPEPHAQVISFHDGKITEILVYSSAEEARRAAGLA